MATIPSLRPRPRPRRKRQAPHQVETKTRRMGHHLPSGNPRLLTCVTCIRSPDGTTGLELLQPSPYLWRAFRGYGDKRARNKRIGPGGGTRRLHQTSLVGGTMGPKQDRRTSKGVSFRSVRYHRYRSKHDSCQRQPCSGRRCRLSGNQTENLKPCSSSKGRRGSQAPGNRSLHLLPICSRRTAVAPSSACLG